QPRRERLHRERRRTCRCASRCRREGVSLLSRTRSGGHTLRVQLPACSGVSQQFPLTSICPVCQKGIRVRWGGGGPPALSSLAREASTACVEAAQDMAPCVVPLYGATQAPSPRRPAPIDGVLFPRIGYA